MDVRRTIEEAFAKTPRPKGKLVDTDAWDEGTSKYFANKTWRGHPVRDLRYHEGSMCFFTPEAHRYFLPAFMIATLENPKEADVIPDNIIFHFSKYDDPFWQKRIAQFSPPERAAIAAFINAVADNYAIESGDVKWALEGLEKVEYAG